jgi:hypothetical protein
VTSAAGEPALTAPAQSGLIHLRRGGVSEKA